MQHRVNFMATRVNTRFVVILSVGLVVVFGAVGAAGLIALKGRDASNVAKADALMAVGKYEDAAKLYERSVGRDRTRQDWLEKWLDALSKSTPAASAEYDQSYGFYRNILRQLAVLRAGDVEAQVRYIRELDRFVRETGASREGLEYLARETDERARDLSSSDPASVKLLRYRGLAYTDQMALLTIDEEKRKQAMADLQAAVAQDPTDWEASLGLVRWRLAEADRGARDGRPEIAATENAEARKLMEAFLAANPGHPEGMLLSFIMDQNELSAARADTSEALRATGDLLLQKANQVVASAVATPADQLRSTHVQRLVIYLARGLGAEGLAPVQEVVERALTVHPDDASLMIARGALLTERGDMKGSIEALQKVVDLPMRPISLEGLMVPARRQTALALQVDAALRMWSDAKQRGDDEAAKSALAAAKQYRTRLADNVGVRGRSVLLLRDAKIAMAENRYPEAVQNLSELRRSEEGQSLEVIQLLAQSLEQQGSLGESRRLYMEIIEKSPNLPGAHAKLGELNVRLGNTDVARGNYVAAMRLEPENKEYRSRLAAIDEALSRGSPSSATSAGQAQTAAPSGSSDPIVGAILDSRARRVDGSDADGLAIIDKALATYPDDNRLIREKVTILLRMDQRAQAVKLLEDRAATHPNDRIIAQMLLLARAEDPVQGQIDIIDNSELAPAEKAVERFEVYLKAGLEDKARAALAEAERLAPDDPRVLDYLFVVALNEKNTARYVELAKRAAEKNIDQMSGLLYQARIELVEGRDREAVLTLERAVKQNEYLPSVRRLLAQSYMKVGRVQDALDSYQRAYDGKPDDVATARDYAIALAGANKGEQALAVVGPKAGVLRFPQAQSDESIIRIWLDLEARYGDRSAAIKVRRQRFDEDPTRLDNTLALNALYIEEKNWEASRAIIAAVESNSKVEPLAISALKANLEAKQGNVDAGRDLLLAHINSIPESERKAREYLTLAEFLIQYDRRIEAGEILEQARKFQDPKLQEIERRLGDLAFENGSIAMNAAAGMGPAQADAKAQLESAAKLNFGNALEAYKRVLTSAPDDIVSRRATETALRLSNPDEAERLLAPVIKASPEDMQTLSLQAGIARQRNDSRKARQLYNRAVELYPNDPNTFLQRAIFSSEDPALLADSLEDLQQAVRLRPSLVNAWVTRATLLKQNGRVPESVAVLRSAVQANPANEELRILLVRELWVSGEQGLAQQEVLRIAAERPDDINWLEEAATFMAQVGRFREAGDLYERSYEKRPNPETAGKVLFTRVQEGVNPNRRDVLKFLAEYEKLDTKGFTKNQLIPSHMLKARARAYLGQEDGAKQQLDAAYALIGDDTAAARFFADELLIALGSPDKVVTYLDGREKQGPLHPFLLVTRVRAQLAARTPPAELLSKAVALEAKEMDEVTRFELCRAIGQIAYQAREHRTCADYYIKALAMSPDHVQLNNDLAYSLAVELHDPQAGLPYAQKAADLTAENPVSSVLDTLGWIQYLCKDREAAQKTLARAASVARRSDQSLIAYCHLGLVQASDGDKEGARRSLQEAEKAARDSPAAAEAFKESLDSLRKAVE